MKKKQKYDTDNAQCYEYRSIFVKPLVDGHVQTISFIVIIIVICWRKSWCQICI